MFGYSRHSKFWNNAETTNVLVDTVCTITGCDPTDIHGTLFDKSNNYLDLEIDDILLKKILSMTPEEKNNLWKQGFDFFIADFITVYLKRLKGKFCYLL